MANHMLRVFFVLMACLSIGFVWIEWNLHVFSSDDTTRIRRTYPENRLAKNFIVAPTSS